MAELFAKVIHDREQRFPATSQEPLALADCIDVDEHYGLAWELVRSLYPDDETLRRLHLVTHR